MIPSDVGIQVRNQTEPGTHPIRAIGDIPADLPELQSGQPFRAQIQEVLPENSYKAVVAGRLLTLSLPEGAKAGDTLDLVVVGRSRDAIIAQRSDTATAALGRFENSNISQAGQLIASLLGPEGESATPANLTRNGPILARIPANGAEIARELAPRLARAVADSGMFYEAHQVQWVLGERSLASLLTEPQGGFSHPALLIAVATGRDDLVGRLPRSDSGARAVQSGEQQPAPDVRGALMAGIGEFEAATPSSGGTPDIPDDLRPLVQQQLEAGASNRLVWQGEVWPNQTMDWEIRRDQAGPGGTPESPDQWQTRLRLTLPRLGEVDVTLQLGGNAVNVSMTAADQASSSTLQSALPGLQGAFASAGLSLAGAQVRHEPA